MSNFHEESTKYVNIYFTYLPIYCCPGTSRCLRINCIHKEPHVYCLKCEQGGNDRLCWQCIPWIEE